MNTNFGYKLYSCTMNRSIWVLCDFEMIDWWNAMRCVVLDVVWDCCYAVGFSIIMAGLCEISREVWFNPHLAHLSGIIWWETLGVREILPMVSIHYYTEFG